VELVKLGQAQAKIEVLIKLGLGGLGGGQRRKLARALGALCCAPLPLVAHLAQTTRHGRALAALNTTAH